MDPLPIFCFLLILEVGLGCKTEYTRKVKQGTTQKSIRQARQSDSFEPICELRDPRRFLQALVVSQLLQPTKLEQTRQGRKYRNTKNRGLKRGERGERYGKGAADTKRGQTRGQRDEKKLGLNMGISEERYE